MPTKPKLTLMTNTPVLSCVEKIRPDIKMNRTVANDNIPKIIHELAYENKLDIVDIYNLFGGNNTDPETGPERFCKIEKPENDYVDGYHYDIHQIAEFIWLYMEKVVDFDKSLAEKKLVEIP